MAADLILGIDPGLNGALALLDIASHEIAELYDMPVLALKSKRELDAYRLAHIIDNHAHEIAEVWIEHVWTRPGEGGPAGFKFGEAFGLVKGVCYASFLPLHEVSPQKWKAAMGVATGDKDDSRKAASILFPIGSARWPLVKHQGRADAVLIASYGKRQFQKLAA
jgi:crossover junction endodeoxyribonuclease RuvC